MSRPIFAFLGALFCISIGAFFLFVPPLLIATAWIALVALPLAAFLLLDCCGIHVEFQVVPPPDDIHR